jgi:hypothetical protein
LAINVFDGWNVTLVEGVPDESEDERRFAGRCATHYDDPVIVGLFHFMPEPKKRTINVLLHQIVQRTKIHFNVEELRMMEGEKVVIK